MDKQESYLAGRGGEGRGGALERLLLSFFREVSGESWRQDLGQRGRRTLSWGLPDTGWALVVSCLAWSWLLQRGGPRPSITPRGRPGPSQSPHKAGLDPQSPCKAGPDPELPCKAPALSHPAGQASRFSEEMRVEGS